MEEAPEAVEGHGVQAGLSVLSFNEEHLLGELFSLSVLTLKVVNL